MMDTSALRVCLVEGYRLSNQWSMKLYAEEVRKVLENCASLLQLQTITATREKIPRWILALPGGDRLARRWTQGVSLPQQLAQTQADVYHCLEPGDVLALRHLDPADVIVSCHDLIPWRLQFQLRRQGSFSWLSRRLYGEMREGLRRSARIVTPSECTRQDVLQFTGITPDRVHVVPYWLNPLFKPLKPDGGEKRRALRRKWQLPATALFLHVGAAVFYKNLETLLKALARMDKRQTTLVRVGSPLTSSQMNLAKHLGIEQRIVQLGGRKSEELVELYQLADALVFPSLYEGFGRPVLEAMACGIPCIVGRGGALPEAADGAARLVDPQDTDALASAMRQVLEDPSLQARLRTQGLDRAQRFRQIDIGARLYALYEATGQKNAKGTSR